MKAVNPQAQELNTRMQKDNPAVFELLSAKGLAMYFPNLGIVKQSADAKGKAIDATIGIAVEDDGTPMRFKAIADRIRVNPKDSFSYASSYGKPELRKKWQEMIRAKNPSCRGTISLPVVTHALTHGLSMAGYLFVDPGDKILVPGAYWENYELLFEMAYGGELTLFNTFKENGFDLEAFEKGLGSLGHKQIVLLTFPNNPTGYTPTLREQDRIVELLVTEAERGHRVLVLSDDAYFGLVYEPGVATESLFARLADAHPNLLAVKIDGATKEDYVWGFRVGFVTYGSKGITAATCSALEAKTAGALRGNISNASHLSQTLVFEGFSAPDYDAVKREKFDALKRRYLKVREVLKANETRYREVFTPLPFNSGYFMCVELLPGTEAEKVRQTLLAKYDTGVIALGRLIRIAFSAVPEDTIPRLFENIYNACKEQ
jgi:aspartate/methionine/tyrosine aminotransferase